MWEKCEQPPSGFTGVLSRSPRALSYGQCLQRARGRVLRSEPVLRNTDTSRLRSGASRSRRCGPRTAPRPA